MTDQPTTKTAPSTVEEAKAVLQACFRDVLVDVATNHVEVTWHESKEPGAPAIATGYFGSRGDVWVSFGGDADGAEFRDYEADQLRHCGDIVRHALN